jgi:hypothetical protein
MEFLLHHQRNRMNRAVAFVGLVLCLMCIVTLLVQGALAAETPWCNTCVHAVNADTSELCAFWNLQDSLRESMYNGTLPSRTSLPVLSDLNTVALLSTASVIAVVFPLVAVLLAFYFLRSSARLLSLILCGAIAALPWALLGAISLVLSSSAWWEWQHELEYGDALCGGLCRCVDTPCCIPSVARAGWSTLLALLIFSVLLVAAAVLGVVLGSVGFFGSNEPQAHVQEAAHPLLATTNSAAAPHFQARVSGIRRDLDPGDQLLAALLTAGCDNDVAEFVARTASSHHGAPFRCPICLDDVYDGAPAVRLHCGGAGGAGRDFDKRDPAALHCFCPPCIAAALCSRLECPLCRERVELPLSFPGS